MMIAKRSPRHYMISSEPWSIWTQGKKIVMDLSDPIYDLAHSTAAKSYWSKKDNVAKAVTESINWELIEAAMNESKRPRRVYIKKHASGMCGVGRFMKRWGMRQEDSRPRCGEPEDSAHVWICHCKGAEDICEQALTNLEHWFNL